MLHKRCDTNLMHNHHGNSQEHFPYGYISALLLHLYRDFLAVNSTSTIIGIKWVAGNFLQCNGCTINEQPMWIVGHDNVFSVEI